ncbi:DUF2244 domain-containing protein [Candidatus Nitrosoglobus terrae]|nr:DUF2244 domain-containing protein [Candidatus Nitrosoglobus terrae]
MVSKRFELSKNEFQFILQPNNSLSWSRMKIVLFAVGATLGVISAGFAFLGLWLVFPFAGLELLALGTAFYLCAHQAQRWEVITIDQDAIKVEVFHGHKMTRETFKFHRYWARVRIMKILPHTWYMSHLMIGSHGSEVEVGVFLNEDERLYLAKELQETCSFS